MDRKQQLGNVSFGGAWSEQIAADEALERALQFVDGAVIDAVTDDLREDPELEAAFTLAASQHPKGRLLATAWAKGLCIGNPGLRSAELQRIAKALRSGIGDRIRQARGEGHDR